MVYVTQQMLNKSAAAVNRERSKQINIIYPSAGLIFWKSYGWRIEKINRIFEMTNAVWHEVVDNHQAILPKLEQETGIELTLMGTDKSYKEVAFLCYSTDDILLPFERAYYANTRMIPWLPTMLLACILIVLHRREHFGYDRLSRFVTEMNQLRSELGEKPKAYNQRLLEETGFDFRFQMVNAKTKENK